MKCKVFKKTVVLESVSYKSGEESEEEAKMTAKCCSRGCFHIVDDSRLGEGIGFVFCMNSPTIISLFYLTL